MNGMENSWAQAMSQQAAIEAFYGPLPTADVALDIELTQTQQRLRYTLFCWRVQAGKPVGPQWTLRLAWPRGAQTAPVLLSPDACWPHVVGAAALRQCLRLRTALAWVDRTQWANDDAQSLHLGPVHRQWPAQPWSAVAVWAWGLGLSGRALRQTMGQQISQLGVVGHSRGGKAALLAASVYNQIDAVVAHNSGTGGASSLQNPPAQAETLAQLGAAFPHWLSAQALRPSVQQSLIEADAPYAWLRAIAPRGLCVLQSLDDLWAHPEGSRRMVERLRPNWQAFPSRLHLQQRRGGHAMGADDWREAARFMRRLTDEGQS
jgi:hypothetical protein